jgi:hypothetical protein
MENKMSTVIRSTVDFYPTYETCAFSIWGAEGSEAGRQVKTETVSFIPGKTISPEKFQEFIADLRAGKPNPLVTEGVLEFTTFKGEYEMTKKHYGVYFEKYFGLCSLEHQISLAVNE